MLWVVMVLSATPVEKLEAGVKALDDLQYAQAVSALPADSEVANFTRDQVISLFSTRALALAMVKREGDASVAFKQLFVVAPEWQLPEQYGPRVRTLVLEAKDFAQRAGVLSLRFEKGAVRATRDALALGTVVELTWRAGGAASKTVTFPITEQAPTPWPADARVEAWGRVIGLNGSTLATWGSAEAPNRFEPPPPVSVVKPVTPGGDSGGIKPMFVAGLASAAVGVGCLVAGGVFTARASEPGRVLASATRDADGRITSITQRDAFALEAQAKQSATIGTALLVVGGVAAAAGAGLVIFGRASATPAPGGVSLTVPLDATFSFAGVSR